MLARKAFLLMMALVSSTGVANAEGMRCFFDVKDTKPGRTILYERTDTGRNIKIWNEIGEDEPLLFGEWAIPQAGVTADNPLAHHGLDYPREIVSISNGGLASPFTFWIDWKKATMDYAAYNAESKKIYLFSPALCIPAD